MAPACGPPRSGWASRVAAYFLRCERRARPSSTVGAGEAHAALQKIHGGLIAHCRSGGDLIGRPYLAPAPGVDDDDSSGASDMPDALQFIGNVGGGRHIAVWQVAEVELDAGLEAPLQRHLVDGPGPLAAIHGRMEMIGRIQMGAVVGGEAHRLHRPALAVGQIVLRQASEERQHLRQALPMVDIVDGRVKAGRVGRNVVLQRPEISISLRAMEGSCSRFVATVQG